MAKKKNNKGMLKRFFKAAERAQSNDFTDWFDDFGDFHDLGADTADYFNGVNRAYIENGKDSFSLKLF